MIDPRGTTRYLQDGRSWPLCAGVGPRTAHGTAVLAPGATLVLYSDGLIERRGEEIDRGLDRLAIAARRLHALELDDLCAVSYTHLTLPTN